VIGVNFLERSNTFMGNIKILDKLLSDMIAAGEVVERPSSVVKEIFENAKDAGSNRITIEIKDGGKAYIKIIDDGCGMDEKDLKLSVVRYATSKLSHQDDLFSIKTMGFRGEALASICAVSKVSITTRKSDEISGVMLISEGGEIVSINPIGCPVGTTVLVENLFYNTPARLKFLKKDATENAYIEETVARLILSNPQISIKFIRDGKEIYYSNGDNDYKSAIYSVYKGNISNNLLKIDAIKNDIHIKGYIGNANIAKPTRKFEHFSVNGRICKSKVFISALENGFFQKIGQGKYPFCVLDIGIDFSLCDVNVHPQKLEIKFANENDIYNAVYTSIKNALEDKLFIKETYKPDFSYKKDEAMPQYKNVNISNIGKIEPQKIEEIKPIFNSISEIFVNRESNENNNIIPENNPIIYQDIMPQKETVEEVSDEAFEYKIVGQIFSSYIIVEMNEEMLLLDQHAACERINYEKIQKEFKNKEINSQILMSPKLVEMSSTDFAIANDNIDVFTNLGIKLEDFSNNTILIREIPSEVKERSIERLIYDIINAIKLSGKMKNEDFNERLLFLVACKMSLKANTELNHFEMASLVEDALKLKGKTTCPHGRPMFISFSKLYIENKFERS
jgi:DNA mismatch repair protein MutL